MSRPDIRFVVCGIEENIIHDTVEGISYVLENSMAKRLCEQLESMHHTIGILLEELDKLKFPPSTQLNADFDAQELFGELESAQHEPPDDQGNLLDSGKKQNG